MRRWVCSGGGGGDGGGVV
uniref:Uncharacterized protein n=1 Tax=Arundo donax TaxID=35708 RepID=A0A0A9FIY0_ARUDO